jgi:hypothetical protein
MTTSHHVHSTLERPESNDVTAAQLLAASGTEAGG